MMKMSYRASRGMMVLEKPELVIESRPEDHFLKAHCSVCPLLPIVISRHPWIGWHPRVDGPEMNVKHPPKELLFV